MIKVKKPHKEWLDDPEYKSAYDAMADEFSLAAAIISARSEAGLTQEQLASKMTTKQSMIARLESGGKNTTIKTLLRIAKATGTHLKISFEH